MNQKSLDKKKSSEGKGIKDNFNVYLRKMFKIWKKQIDKLKKKYIETFTH